MIYKISYVVQDHSHPGAILDADEMPKIGDVITFGGREFRVTDVMELMPARSGFGFVHATCVPLEEERD